jgi:hypothetical protein
LQLGSIYALPGNSFVDINPSKQYFMQQPNQPIAIASAASMVPGIGGHFGCFGLD